MNKPNKPLYNEATEKFSRLIVPALVLAGIGAHKMGFTTVYHCLIAAAAVLCIPLVLFRFRQQRCRYAETVYGQQLISAFSGKGQKKLRYKLVDAVWLQDKKEKYRKSADLLEELEKSCKTDVDFAVVQMFLGDAYRLMGNYTEGECYYLDSLSHGSGDDVLWSNLGICLSRNGKHEEAIKWLEKAVEADSTSPTNYNNLANSYYRCGEYEKCLIPAMQALKHLPTYASPALTLCLAYYQLGNKEKSDEYFEKCVQLDCDPKKLEQARQAIDMDREIEALEAKNESDA